MKYVIMCGGKYKNFETPKQLLVVNGERIVDRTIRLLKENGITDIVITSGNPVFDSCGVPRIEDKNNDFSQEKSWTGIKGWWMDCFYHFNEPACYLFGDVYYSDKAIKTIIEAETDTQLLFGSNPKSSEGYLIKTWYEPFCFKVVDYKNFYKAIDEVKKLSLEGKVKRHPIAWELYRHLNHLDINSNKLEEHFITINDYTTDIDNATDKENDIERIEYFLAKEKGQNKVVSKCFGIISYLPTNGNGRMLRKQRLTRLFEQIHELFGDVNYIVIAQNWNEYRVPSFVKNIQIINKPPLGITKARQELREAFLNSNYDYLIMCDDDVIMEVDSPLIPEAYMDELNLYPKGFLFLQYEAAQLNMCAISRYIYEQEPMVDIDPQKNEGYEDTIFSNLLHYKYRDYECNNFYGLRCVQFQNPKESAPSTWASTPGRRHSKCWSNTLYYLENIYKGNYDIEELKKNNPKREFVSIFEKHSSLFD